MPRVPEPVSPPAGNKQTEFYEPLGPPGLARTGGKGPCTFDRKQLRKLVAQEPSLEPVTEPRPRCRADCADGPRPCPWVGCRWNLYLDVTEAGSLQLNFPQLDVDEVPNNCVLDLADRSGMTLEQIGQVLNVTRERVRQIETIALGKLVGAELEHAPDASGFTFPEGPPHGGAK